MTVKTSISLTDSQDAFARALVEQGRYPSLSAVLQHGLELLRSEREREAAELAALRAVLDARAAGPFMEAEDARALTQQMIAAKRAAAKAAE